MRNLRNVQGLGKNEVFHTILPDGTPGTAKTIGYAQQLIREGLKNPRVRELTLRILSDAGVRGFDELGELETLYAWVLANFFFRDDPVGYQYLQPVTGLLRTRSGNCASLNLVLLPALLGGVGFPTRAITIKSDPSMPEEYSHVYIEAQLKDGRWIPLDVARPDAAFGLAPNPGAYWEKAAWALTSGEGTGGTMNGLHPAGFRGGVGRRVVARLGPAPFTGLGMGRGPRPLALAHARRVRLRGLGQSDGDLTNVTGNIYQDTSGNVYSFDSSGGVSIADPTGQNVNYYPANAPSSPVAPSVSSGPGTATSILAAAQTLPAIFKGTAQIIAAKGAPAAYAYSQTPGLAPGGYAPNVSLSAGGSSTIFLVLGLLVAGVVAVSVIKK
ncbi:MAG: transglutaminase domain-containing protein [Candidatus Acidiferrales bacterium]